MRNFLENHLLEAILYLVLIVAFCNLLTGCVNRQLTESYRQYLDTVGTEYIEYVENDQALSRNEKELRQMNHDQAVKTVEKFENTKWSW